MNPPRPLLLAPVVLLVACGTHDARSPAATDWRARHVGAITLHDAVGTDAVAVGGRIYVAVVGKRDRVRGAKATAVQVVSRPVSGDSRSWRREPPIARSISTGGGVSLAQTADAPCVGYATPALRPYVACLRHGAWSPAGVDRLAGSGGIFNQLVADRGALLALMRDPRKSRHVVLRFSDGAWRTLGQPLSSRMAIARLAVNDGTSGAPSIAMEEVGSPPFTRTLRSYRNGVWRSEGPPLAGVGQGPLTSGPARVGSRSFVTVAEADRQEPWPFSVYTSRLSTPWRAVGGGALNRGAGSAQGDLSTVAGEAWVSWQQHTPAPDGAFATTVYAARLSGAGTITRAPSVIWRGMNAGPSTTKVIGVGTSRWGLCLGATTSGAAVPILRRLR